MWEWLDTNRLSFHLNNGAHFFQPDFLESQFFKILEKFVNKTFDWVMKVFNFLGESLKCVELKLRYLSVSLEFIFRYRFRSFKAWQKNELVFLGISINWIGKKELFFGLLSATQ